jgi:hypothetical protein
VPVATLAMPSGCCNEGGCMLALNLLGTKAIIAYIVAIVVIIIIVAVLMRGRRRV